MSAMKDIAITLASLAAGEDVSATERAAVMRYLNHLAAQDAPADENGSDGFGSA